MKDFSEQLSELEKMVRKMVKGPTAKRGEGGPDGGGNRAATERRQLASDVSDKGKKTAWEYQA